MEVRFVTTASATTHDPDELPELLTRADGLVWVDVPDWDDVEAVLTKNFDLHPLALRDS
ncbi:MAG TPA: hypothetical protein VIW24_12330 [Aldersonia sp.]